MRKFYIGNITPDANTIFVFGSNPEGRHGAGAARVARAQFGAVYGQGEGLQGNAYALPTKDLRVTENRGLRSISESQIIENINKERISESNDNKPMELPCHCENNPFKLDYYHNNKCNGVLYKGDIFRKKIVVCSVCRIFASVNKFKWICPICNTSFKTTG